MPGRSSVLVRPTSCVVSARTRDHGPGTATGTKNGPGTRNQEQRTKDDRDPALQGSRRGDAYVAAKVERTREIVAERTVRVGQIQDLHHLGFRRVALDRDD